MLIPFLSLALIPLPVLFALLLITFLFPKEAGEVPENRLEKNATLKQEEERQTYNCNS